MAQAVSLAMLDLDGTLLNSLDDLTAAANAVRAHFGLPALTRDEVRPLVGQGARRLVERALPGASVAEVDEGVARYIEYNRTHIVCHTTLYPGVRETLQVLHDRGVRLAVISNKQSVLCCEVLRALGVLELFAAVLGADALPARKPSPEPVLAVLRQFDTAPDAAAMIGDSRNDIDAGHGAGVLTVACTYGYEDPATLTDADYCISAFPELLELPPFSMAVEGA